MGEARQRIDRIFMKIVIGGAGKVGWHIAQYFSAEGKSVTVIDESPQLITEIQRNLDVQALVGSISNPETLESANTAEADIFIAFTQSDEVNMIACQLAHILFQTPRKVARIHNQTYLQPKWGNLFTYKAIPVDVILSPSIEVANAIMQRLRVFGTTEFIPHAHERLYTVGVLCFKQCPVLHTPLRQLTSLFPALNLKVLALIRHGKFFIPDSDDQILPEDEVYFIVDAGHIERAMNVFGYEYDQKNRRILILGGGEVGFHLAKEIETHLPQTHLSIIEMSRERARFISQRLHHTQVLEGNILDPDRLEEASIETTETSVAVTPRDETNMFASLLAKRYGCTRTLTLLNKHIYATLMPTLSIDTVINPGNIFISSVLRVIRQGHIIDAHSLRNSVAELIEAEILDTTELVNKSLKEMKFPSGILVGALIRDEQVIMPKPTTIFRVKDRIILLVTQQHVRTVERLFRVSLEFF